MIRQQLSRVGLVLGAVLLVIGLARFNLRLLLPGVMLFVLGLVLHFLGPRDGEA